MMDVPHEYTCAISKAEYDRIMRTGTYEDRKKVSRETISIANCSPEQYYRKLHRDLASLERKELLDSLSYCLLQVESALADYNKAKEDLVIEPPMAEATGFLLHRRV